MQTAQTIQLSDYIPRKPADRGGQLYRCADCGKEWAFLHRKGHAVYCAIVFADGCGAEMRPTEAK